MTSLAAEDHRIATHLARTERALRRAPTGRLRASQRTMRARALDSLHEYSSLARFPRNPRFAEATPYFIDAGATRCAMAWVLEQSGGVELVRRVADSANNATIADLAGDAELLHWLDTLGLTVEEAALVQPTYCFYKKGDCFCRQTYGTSPSADQVVTGVVLSTGAGSTFRARVETLLGGEARTAVGDELEIGGAATPGASVLLALVHDVDAGTVGAMRVPAEQAGYVACGDPPFGISIDRSDVVSALLGSDCLAALGAKDARFLEPVCDGKGETGPASDATVSDSGKADAAADSRGSTTSDSSAPGTGDASLDSPGSAPDASTEVGDEAVDSAQSTGCAVRGVVGGEAPMVIALVAVAVASRRLRRSPRSER